MNQVPFHVTEPVPDVPHMLSQHGPVFRSFLAQDSDSHSYGVEVGGQRFFVKHAVAPDGVASLERAVAFHAAVRHPAIVPLSTTFPTRFGPALVYPWQDGDVLYHPAERGADRDAPGSPHRRFRELPPPEVQGAIAAILDAHVVVAAAGFVAVDLYDGCCLYDFSTQTMHLIDLDEYRPGPFTVEAERLPGSTRFMAPEEFRCGAVIDERTTVFNLGRMISVLTEAVRRPERVDAVIAGATAADRAARYPLVTDLVAAWRASC